MSLFLLERGNNGKSCKKSHSHEAFSFFIQPKWSWLVQIRLLWLFSHCEINYQKSSGLAIINKGWKIHPLSHARVKKTMTKSISGSKRCQKHSNKKITSIFTAFLPMHMFASEVVEVTGKFLWACVYSVGHPEIRNKCTAFSDVIFSPYSLSLFKLNLVAHWRQCFISDRWTVLPLKNCQPCWWAILLLEEEISVWGKITHQPSLTHFHSPSCLFSCMLHQAELLQ